MYMYIQMYMSQGWAPCLLVFVHFMGWGFLGFLSPPFLFASVLDTYYVYHTLYHTFDVFICLIECLVFSNSLKYDMFNENTQPNMYVHLWSCVYTFCI